MTYQAKFNREDGTFEVKASNISTADAIITTVGVVAGATAVVCLTRLAIRGLCRVVGI